VARPGYTPGVFTGLVEDVGRIAALERQADAVVLHIETKAIDAASLALGESVAVDGCCLTVTARKPGQFQVLAGPETLSRTTVGRFEPGTRVNLERAMLATARFGGHIVTIAARTPTGPAVDVVFQAGPEILRYVVEKGSICVDGISLTVNRVDGYSFAVGLIPHTLEHTSLADKQVGAAVNLEVDIVGKYVEKLLAGHLPARQGSRT
jgi:riboflavin synthase